MATIGEVYNPLVEAAQKNDPKGHELLKEVGAEIFKAYPDKCPTLEDGIKAARKNLNYYCQYFSEEVALKVKDFYGLGQEFVFG